MKKIDFKKSILPILGIIALYAVISIVYCKPVLEGKIISAGDKVNAVSNMQECLNYTIETGKYSWWTNALFGGMPNYQIGGGKYAAEKALAPFVSIKRAGTNNPIFTLLFYMIAFFILLRSFEIKRPIAAIGAIAMAFSSYFFIIIGAGHAGKTAAITWMAIAFAGMNLCYRKKYGLGVVCTMIGMACGYTAHPQMAYYMLMMVAVMVLAELYIFLKEKKIKEWLVCTAFFMGAMILGFGTNLSNTFANAEYAAQTMRGGHSDLITDEAGETAAKGLDIEYATQWSYGIDETLTFLIPNFKGGSSNYPLGRNSYLYKEMVKKKVAPQSAASFCSSAPLYWGDQPFTAGPVYMGAVICFLFVLGLMIVKGPYKWALLAATLFSVLLSFGHNFMPLTKLFFNFFPLYNKFRAVSSILIVAEITMPLLGFLALKEVVEGNVSKEKLKQSTMISFAITGGLCLLVALFGPSTFSFSGVTDAQLTGQLPEWLYPLMVTQREQLLVNDAWRSLVFVLLGAALVWLLTTGKIKPLYLLSALGVLILVDMWQVDKRYFNDSNFETLRTYNQAYAIQPYEESIKKDPDIHFRVMNTTTNTFNESRTSFYLKSIGGYHAAKLRRYQDLIDVHLSKGDLSVISMLNTKYIIVPGQDGQPQPLRNSEAMGNGWFVENILAVDNPNDEINNLTKVDLHTTAVVDKSLFQDFVTAPAEQVESTVKLTQYAPDELEYDIYAENPGTVVFSEIYYPHGWKAYIDGEPADHFRANYVLRALNVPQGKHIVKFEFRPDSVRKGDTLALIFIGLFYLIIVGVAVTGVKRYFSEGE